MNRKLITGIVVAVIVAIGVVATLALQKDNTKSTDTTGGTNHNTSTDESSQGESPVATSSVTIQDFAFSPAKITVKKGTKVTWTNKDSAQHTVTGENGSGPASGTLGTGDAYSFTFDTTGTFTYRCNFHGSMVGTVVVTE